MNNNPNRNLKKKSQWKDSRGKQEIAQTRVMVGVRTDRNPRINKMRFVAQIAVQNTHTQCPMLSN